MEKKTYLSKLNSSFITFGILNKKQRAKHYFSD